MLSYLQQSDIMAPKSHLLSQSEAKRNYNKSALVTSAYKQGTMHPENNKFENFL